MLVIRQIFINMIIGLLMFLSCLLPCVNTICFAETADDYSLLPPFVSGGAPPLVMLVMGKDHKLYFEAYDDATDLNNDGIIETKYWPETKVVNGITRKGVDYYGYFDSYTCYDYSSSNQRFEPISTTSNKKCGGSHWSGDFLNYLTMTRMDCLRKVLYGGYRSTDDTTETVLERVYIPEDSHTFGREYTSEAVDGYLLTDYTPLSMPATNTRHLFANVSLGLPSTYPPLLRIYKNTSYRIWEWIAREVECGHNSIGASGTIDTGNSAKFEEKIVRVRIGASSNKALGCPVGKYYPNNTTNNSSDDIYKPIGILQKHGESNRMYFGLITGSYAHNLKGGVLRKKITSITDEIDAQTGKFTSVNGIIKSISALRIAGYSHSSHRHDCGLLVSRPLDEEPDGTCRMWGNPIAEMMYEGMRYFSGRGTPTGEFTYTGSETSSDNLGLPLASAADWADPYATCDSCAKPFMVVISDIYPSYDTDQLPGSYFKAFSETSPALSPSLNVSTLGDFISDNESIAGQHYIGQSEGTYTGSCSAKSVSGFDKIRGLCPDDPTRKGGYYSASVAYYGRTRDLSSSASGSQSVTTYVVGLSSPLPELKIQVGTNRITLVPFTKSAYYSGTINSSAGQFQPTNQIAGFFVTEFTPTSGTFRINFEDSEQGNDFDMDAVGLYHYEVVDNNGVMVSDPSQGTRLKLTLTCDYAAGGIQAHLGYIISGTTDDGTYLDVRDSDTAEGNYYHYFMDTLVSPAAVLPTTQTRFFTPSGNPPATLLKNPLWYAAKWGGFESPAGTPMTNDYIPSTDEWDKDHDGVPDTYFYVANPLKLEEQLSRSFEDILRRDSSGTAASVISSSRSGEGAIYQSIFYTDYPDTLGNRISWAGEVHSFLVDAYGNMREDTNGNHKLDLIDDLIIKFSTEYANSINKYRDANGNGQLESSELASPVVLNAIMKDLRPLWSASNWLNEISDTDILANRDTIGGTASKRYIFTFLDANKNMIPDSGDIVPFLEANAASIEPYLHVFSPFSPPSVSNLSAYVEAEAVQQINYIRGLDQLSDISSSGNTLPKLRSRHADYDGDGTVETWRLGDIVYSTPTVVGAPAEDFDLLYKDTSYVAFYRKYRNRRNVVYVGANDGMLHAFNGGFFDSSKKQFWKSYNSTDNEFRDTVGALATSAGPELGAELWAYIPYNLLPHLYWLTDTNYNSTRHIAYVDLKPRVFDAKIFANDSEHPNGWGTVLVCGMRLGGGKIRVDKDKTDGAYNPAVDRTMSSSFFIMDITNPEAPPVLLAEVSSDDLGFTTCYPTVLTMKDLDSTQDSNQWFLVLGSGPAGTGGAISDALKNGSSNQSANIALLDLKSLVSPKSVKTLKRNGTAVTLEAGVNLFASLDANAFVSDPIAVDYDLDYKADAIYFGTVSGSFSSPGWGGKLRRIVSGDDTTPANWKHDSTLIDLTTIASLGSGQPIVAAPSVGVDSSGQRWVFFGTGRFYNRSDATNAVTSSQQQSYYGLKEPYTIDFTDPNRPKTFSCLDLSVYDATNCTSTATITGTKVIDRTKLLNVTNAQVYEGGGYVTGIPDPVPDPISSKAINGGTFSDLQLHMEPPTSSTMATVPGWFLNFDTSKERNLGQATLLGDILTFTAYIPSESPCRLDDSSWLYTVYFTTGTAYKESVIGTGTSTHSVNGETKHDVLRKDDLGQGLTITPNLHTGREEGSQVFLQTSTGAIVNVGENNPGAVKTGRTSWIEMSD